MSHQIWSILLFVCVAQSFFIIIALLIKPLANKRAAVFLLALLTIIFLTTVSNIWSSTFLYRRIPEIAGFARGMVLLLGPVLYLYVLSVLKPGFSFKIKQLLHFLPYLVGFIIIRVEEGGISHQLFIANVDKFMEDGAPINWLSTLWFVAYFTHLLIYVLMARRDIKLSLKNEKDSYLVPIERRATWLKRITIFFVIIAFVFIGNVVYIILSGVTSILTNYIYNIVLAGIVYFIAFQAISDNKILTPDFNEKYRSNRIDKILKGTLLTGLANLLEKEKIFVKPELTLANVAERLGVHQNIISRLINEHYNKTFHELINYYRIEEFKLLVKDPGYTAYSIIGVAYEVGYNTKSAFNSAFKKQTGLTPSEYMKTIL